MGIAIINPTADYSRNNIGQVTTVVNEVILKEKLISDGNAYINTGIKLQEGDEVYFRFKCNTEDNIIKTILGSRKIGASYDTNGNVSICNNTGRNYGTFISLGGTMSDPRSTSRLSGSLEREVHFVVGHSAEMIVNGVTSDLTNQDYSQISWDDCVNDMELYLFALNINNAAIQVCNRTDYVSAFSVKRNNAMILDLVPAIVNNKVGMWDSVSKTLFTSEVGEFTAV